MPAMKTVRRVTIYTLSTMERHILQKCMSLGAHGYSALDCRGKGKHEVTDDPFVGAERVRLELVVEPEIALKICEHFGGAHYRSKAILITSESVDVMANEEF